MEEGCVLRSRLRHVVSMIGPQEESIEILERILMNLMREPRNRKYQILRKNNAKIVTLTQSSIKLLNEVGFIDTGDYLAMSGHVQASILAMALEELQKMRRKVSTRSKDVNWIILDERISIEKFGSDLAEIVAQPHLKRELESLHEETSVLLYGPPGNGKSLMARYLARARGPALIVHDTAVLELAFSLAEKYQPCTLIVEDIDHTTNNVIKLPENVYLIVIMNTLSTKSNRRRDSLSFWDTFSSLLYVPLPDRSARRELVLLTCASYESSELIEDILDQTEAFSCRAVVGLISSALRLAATTAAAAMKRPATIQAQHIDAVFADTPTLATFICAGGLHQDGAGGGGGLVCDWSSSKNTLCWLNNSNCAVVTPPCV